MNLDHLPWEPARAAAGYETVVIAGKHSLVRSREHSHMHAYKNWTGHNTAIHGHFIAWHHLDEITALALYHHLSNPGGN